MSRRRFLVGVGGAAVTLAAVGADQLSGPRSRGVTSAHATAGTRELVIETREVTWELRPGTTIRGLGYNGRIPGPEIRVKEGKRLRIVLKNALHEPTTLHWHGVDVPNAMDGVAGLTQAPVPAGGTFDYEFVARPAGTRWYHTHFQEHRQMDLGLVAPLIIEPTGGETVPFDREHTLILDDWATGSGPSAAPHARGNGRRPG